MPLLAPGDVAEKAAAVEHFMAGCNRRAGRPGRAGQQRGLPSGRSLGSAGYRRFRPRPRGQPPRRRAVQDQRLTADSCGGSRRLAPGPEVQPGRTAFPFHPLARDRRRTTLSLSLRGGQTADPIGFARVASAPIGGALRFMPMCKYDVHNAIPSNNASSYILHRSRRRVRLWSVLHMSAERIASYSDEVG
jgi:hypothetical protein